MRLMLVTLVLCFLSQAFAEVPISNGIAPAARPVGGPIKPRNQAVVEPSDNEDLQRVNFGGYAPMAHTTAIFWGARWRRGEYSGDKIEGLDQLYYGFDDSRYAHSTDEYRLLPGIFPQKADLSYTGHIILPTDFGKPVGDVTDFATVSAKVCELAESGQIKLRGFKLSFFPVYLDRHRPKGSACSMHGYYQFGSTYCPGNWRTGPQNVFLIAMFYNLDEDLECDVEDPVTGHSDGLAALANQTAGVIADVRTDAIFGTLYDSNGNEVGDKCAWVFQEPFVTLSNGSIWKLQSLWSNAAYEAGTGYPNRDGARGCVDGNEPQH